MIASKCVQNNVAQVWRFCITGVEGCRFTEKWYKSFVICLQLPSKKLQLASWTLWSGRLIVDAIRLIDMILMWKLPWISLALNADFFRCWNLDPYICFKRAELYCMGNHGYCVWVCLNEVRTTFLSGQTLDILWDIGLFGSGNVAHIIWNNVKTLSAPIHVAWCSYAFKVCHGSLFICSKMSWCISWSW